MSRMFCDKGQKCKISPYLPLGSLEMYICGESSPKFQMYNVQKVNSALTREKSKCHNWNTGKCRKSIQVRNFDPQSARRGNWGRLWGREGRFPCTHISTPKVQNCENVSWLNGLLLSSFSSMGKMWLVHFESNCSLLHWVWGALSDWFSSIEEALNPKVSIKQVMVKFVLIE